MERERDTLKKKSEVVLNAEFSHILFVCPLQNLSLKVRLNKVDPFYFHHPKSRLGAQAKDETRYLRVKRN